MEMIRKVNITASKSGLPCLDECGGGWTNTGFAQIVADALGRAGVLSTFGPTANLLAGTTRSFPFAWVMWSSPLTDTGQRWLSRSSVLSRSTLTT